MRFEISVEGGPAKSVHVISNSGTEELAEIAVAVVTKAVFPPMPPDVAAVSNYKPRRMEESFTVNTNTRDR